MSKTPVTSPKKTAQTPAKASSLVLLVTVQTKFVVANDILDKSIWKEHWPEGRPVAAAKVELVESKTEATTNGLGRVSLDASKLSTGSYTLKLTPAQGNAWSAASRNTYSSDQALTARYEPVELTVSVSVEGASLTVDKVEVAEDLRSKVTAKVTGNGIVVDWRPAWIASPNMGTRPKNAAISLILVHRTGTPLIGSPINMFTRKDSTSAHYVIDTDGYVLNLVADTHRSFHAGYSWWNGRKDLNDVAIGIEIVNGSGPFTDQQYTALFELLTRLMQEHSISRHGILAHSDIRVSKTDFGLSSDRGVCPGPEFRWDVLMEKGFSSKPNPELYAEGSIDSEYGSFFKDKPKDKLAFGQQDKNLVNPATKTPYGIIEALQTDLSTIGYSINPKNGIDKTGVYDAATQAAVDRFRRHFMAGLLKLTGNLDPTFDRATAIAMKRVIKDRAT
jgi:N-acetyl-anhydromuramyl-L-alanine amidase AmpD